MSIYGSFVEVRKTDYNNEPEFLPLADHWEWARSEKTVRQYYPELFCHPLEAKQRIDWGRYEVGFDHKVTPVQLRSLFGWTFRGRLAQDARESARQALSKTRECYRVVVPYQLRHRASMIRSSEYRRKHQVRVELERLERTPRYTPTSTNLLGKSFELVDSRSFLAQYNAIFQQQIYRFETRKAAPLIIDGGANIGLSVLYFKRSFPHCRILAFEPDPNSFRLLTKNCAAFDLDNVELIPKALWTQEGVVRFDSDGADAGRVMPHTNSLQAVDVGHVAMHAGVQLQLLAQGVRQ